MTAATHVFIDWDDTLFPSTWIHDTDINIRNPQSILSELFESLDILLCRVITSFISKNSTPIIVSNGNMGWLNLCMDLLPTFKQFYNSGQFKMFSANDLFSENNPKKHMIWKLECFKMCLEEYRTHIPNVDHHHIISIGDSKDEHNALKELAGWNNCKPKKERILKSVVLKKKPSINEIVDQLEEIINIIEHIVDHPTPTIITLK